MESKQFLLFFICLFLFLSQLLMANKVEKVLLPVKEDPTVSFRIWFKVGSENDPKGKEGLAYITAKMLTEASTKTNSFEKILEKLYPIASSYSDKVDKEMTVIYGRTHKDNINEFYQLFTDAILNPAFNEDDFKRIKTNAINFIQNDLRYSNDEELGKAALYGFIFEGTPYSHLTIGTIESLNSMTLDDVRGFYERYYNRYNFVIGLGGGFDSKLVERLEKDLSQLSDVRSQIPPKPKVAPIVGYNFLMIEKDADATAISFGFPINILRNDEDFVALWVFNSWFGEHRNQSSHLYQVIREKRGLNYGDYSYIEAFLNGGQRNMPEPNNPRRQQIFEVWIRPVQNQHRHFALRAALRELKKVIDNGLTNEDFDLTKKFLYSYSLNYAQTTMDKLGYQIDSKFYGVNDDGNYINYFRKKLNSLKLEDVNRAIKKYIQYENIKFAIVTKNADEFKEDLVNNVSSPISYPTEVDDSVLKEDLEIQNFSLNIDRDKVKIVKVDEMFQK